MFLPTANQPGNYQKTPLLPVFTKLNMMSTGAAIDEGITVRFYKHRCEQSRAKPVQEMQSFKYQGSNHQVEDCPNDSKTARCGQKHDKKCEVGAPKFSN